MQCRSCGSHHGFVSNGAVRLSKYLVRPRRLGSSDYTSSIWTATLLATLQYHAASSGTRRFLLRPVLAREADRGLEIWLFSRANLTTSLSKYWYHMTSRKDKKEHGNPNWRGYRVFCRDTSKAATQATDQATEAIDIPNPVYTWTLTTLQAVTDSMPPELQRVLTGWNAAYLTS